MRFFKFPSLLFFLLTIFMNFASAHAFADITFIANPSQKDLWTEKQVRDVYLGILKIQKVDLVDQVESPVRDEFYEKFLKKTESQLKQQWSILIFSGERVPQILGDDKAVFEYVKAHRYAVAYVSSAFWEKEAATTSPKQPIKLFSVR